ncbi:RNA polymerase sigma factor [Prevotella sp. PTAC]|uniref:RNA polymerase sigma factor n=1 Tax=Prevotella sp. PTAC TaxID=2736295 RepID=UPI0015520E7F|nr:sigma-70 family RNA polymerase sigma factor [Prevotella sp. PTAC]NPD53880.1 sigma-70 family RNA polymerase sigma factor [Prevotella sp. PTAC]
MSTDSEQHMKRFESLIAERQDWLFRFAYMRVGRREDAEDIVQEVFMSIFCKMKKDKDIKDIDRYMIRSVSNACTDYHRRRKQNHIQIDDMRDIPVTETDRQIHDEFTRINRLLDSLPPEQAETVRLKCYDNLTFRQIAELTEVPEATVKSRYRYAITHIQQRLRKEHNNEG